MSDNPSAGKFDPPPEPAAPKIEGWNGTRIVITLLLLGIPFASHWLRSFRGRGWLTMASGAAVFALIVADFVLHRLHRRRAAGDGGEDPYTPPTHLTR